MSPIVLVTRIAYLYLGIARWPRQSDRSCGTNSRGPSKSAE
jgi:hypothetical protein